VVYDLLFYFIVIIIVLNLIFGVIIDTFADLRSEKQKKEEVLKTTCFICGERTGGGEEGWRRGGWRGGGEEGWRRGGWRGGGEEGWRMEGGGVESGGWRSGG